MRHSGLRNSCTVLTGECGTGSAKVWRVSGGATGEHGERVRGHSWEPLSRLAPPRPACCETTVTVSRVSHIPTVVGGDSTPGTSRAARACTDRLIPEPRPRHCGHACPGGLRACQQRLVTEGDIHRVNAYPDALAVAVEDISLCLPRMRTPGLSAAAGPWSTVSVAPPRSRVGQPAAKRSPPPSHAVAPVSSENSWQRPQRRSERPQAGACPGMRRPVRAASSSQRAVRRSLSDSAAA